MRHRSLRLTGWVAVALLASAGLAVQPERVSSLTFVPWKVLKPGDAPSKSALVLYWIPTSADEMRRSELLTSRALNVVASHCVAMQVVRSDDEATIERLGAEGKLPMVVMCDADGVQVAVIESAEGVLRTADVERIVLAELDERAAEADRLLDEAKAKADAGDREGAIAIYRRVSDQRCLWPRQGKDAARALRKLEK